MSEEIKKRNLFNIEAEQTVLGALILNNDYYDKIQDILKPDDFYEPAHQKIYNHFQETKIKSNLVADSVILKTFFDNDEIISGIGGSTYLGALLKMGSSIINIVDYAVIISDLATKRKLVMLGEDVVNESYKTDAENTANKIIEDTESKLFSLSVSNKGNNNTIDLSSSLKETINKTKLAIERDGNISGIPADYIDIDKLLGGFQEGDLVILAGRPSMGKSALAINFAYNAAKFFQEEYEEGKVEEKKSVAFFSLEMPSDQIASRILARETNINSTNFRTGDIDKKDFDKIVDVSNNISKMPLYIDDTPAMSISTIKTKVRRLVRQKNLGILFIDYLQLAKGISQQSRTNRVLEIGEITMGLKAIAKEFKIPIVALSQLSRTVELRQDKKPQLADLRESGSIEQDADVVMFIYREEYYEERRKPADGDPEMEKWIARMNRLQHKAEVIIAKNRNGPIGNVILRFDGATSNFQDYAGQYDIQNQ